MRGPCLRTLQYWQSQLKIALLPRHNEMMRQVPLFGVCMAPVSSCCCSYLRVVQPPLHSLSRPRQSCATAPPDGGRRRCTPAGPTRLQGQPEEERGSKFGQILIERFELLGSGERDVWCEPGNTFIFHLWQKGSARIVPFYRRPSQRREVVEESRKMSSIPLPSL